MKCLVQDDYNTAKDPAQIFFIGKNQEVRLRQFLQTIYVEKKLQNISSCAKIRLPLIE